MVYSKLTKNNFGKIYKIELTRIKTEDILTSTVETDLEIRENKNALLSTFEKSFSK